MKRKMKRRLNLREIDIEREKNKEKRIKRKE